MINRIAYNTGMPAQTKHQIALTAIHRTTLAAAKLDPGDTSPGGFKRVGLRVPNVRAMGKALRSRA